MSKLLNVNTAAVCPRCGRIHPPTTNERRLITSAGPAPIPAWIVPLAKQLATNADRIEALQRQVTAGHINAGTRPPVRPEDLAQPPSLIDAIQANAARPPLPVANVVDGQAQPLSLIDMIRGGK